MLLAAVLAVAEQRDVVHRARAVERDERDDVAEIGRAHRGQRARACPPIPAGTRPPCRRAGAGRRLPGRPRPAYRDRPSMPRWRSRRWPSFSTDSVLRPEEVELHQAGALDIFHVELGDRHVRARIAIERHQVVRAAGRRSPRRRRGWTSGAAGPPASWRDRTGASRLGIVTIFGVPARARRSALRSSVQGSVGWLGISLARRSTWP